MLNSTSVSAFQASRFMLYQYRGLRPRQRLCQPFGLKTEIRQWRSNASSKQRDTARDKRSAEVTALFVMASFARWFSLAILLSLALLQIAERSGPAGPVTAADLRAPIHSIQHLPNRARQRIKRFARSVWKTERLWDGGADSCSERAHSLA